MVCLAVCHCLGFHRTADAVPAAPGGVTVRQPDGASFAGYLKGDEYGHWNEDARGYPIVKSSQTHFWVYAQQAGNLLTPTATVVGRGDPARAGLRKTVPSLLRAGRSEMRARGSRSARVANTGILKNLVILVAFADKAGDFLPSDYSSLFNDTGYTSDGAVGSVKDFFSEVSYNALAVDSTVTIWVTLDNGYAYYGANVDGYDVRPREMVQEALAELDATGFDFTTVDGDGDGWVDGLDVIHAGGGEEYFGNDPNYIWSHASVLPTPVTYDGVSMQSYHTEPARRGLDAQPATQGITRIGVICHETGHFLGLPDLYDYGYDSAGVGSFCLMAGGSWNGEGGTSPAHLSAWCKTTLGWVTPTEIITSGTYQATQVETTTGIFRLHGDFSRTNEYFLLENRQGVGFDAGLPGPLRGILIWHIDENQPNNDDQTHFSVDLEEASGVQHLELGENSGEDSDYFRSGNVTQFGDATNPDNRSYSDEKLGLAVTSIGATGPLMSFGVLANDDCSTSTVIDALPYTNTQDTAGAQNSGDPFPSCASNFGKGVWYEYTADRNMTVWADTEGSDFDTAIAIYTGDCASPTESACDNDSGTGTNALVSFAATAGTTYLFLVGGNEGESGSLTFNVYTIAPDLQIKSFTEPDAAFGGNDVYQTIPSGSQVETQTTDPTVTVSYSVKIENDSATAQTFLIKATESVDTGWTVAYKVGPTDITLDVLENGYTTALLNPGGSEPITVEMTPALSVAGGASKSTTISVYLDGADITVRDVVQAATTASGIADLLIKADSQPDAAYAIKGEYRSTPQGEQIETQHVEPQVPATYQIKLDNDGTTARSFVLNTTENLSAGWTATYFVDGSDITEEITQPTGYLTTLLNPGQSNVVTLTLTPSSGVVGGIENSCVIEAFLESDATIRDAVKAVAVASRPDLLVKQGTEDDTAYALDGVYQTTAAGDQIESQGTPPDVAAVYDVRVDNDSGELHAYVLKSTEPAESGWTVAYSVDGADITSSVRGASGYTMSTLAAGASQAITVEVTPSLAVVGGGTNDVDVRVYRTSIDTTVRDAVRLSTTATDLDRPDASIKADAEQDSDYSGDGVYQTTPTGDQVEELSIDQGGIATFQVKVENDGNTTRGFLIQAVENAPTGWTLTYKVGDTDVTSALLGSGYATSVLVPGAGVVIDLTTTSAPTVLGGTAKTATFNVFLDGDAVTVRDSVQASCTVRAVDRVDALIRSESETDLEYALDDVYQSTPSGNQIELQSVDPNKLAIHLAKIQNDGNTNRTFVVRSTESAGSDWLVAYLVGSTEVTSAITSESGYTTASLLPSESIVISISMKPGSDVPGGETKSSTVGVYLDAADTTVRDAVQASTSANGTADLMIKQDGENEFAFGTDDVYQSAPGADQVEPQTVGVKATATYNIQVQNDGDETQSFVLKASESSETGWTSTYRVGPADITNRILSGQGYNTADILPGATEIISVDVEPGTTVNGGDSKTVTIKAYLDSQSVVVRDAVSAVTTLSRADLLIKAAAEDDAAFGEDGVYEETPSGAQIESQTSDPSVTTIYRVKVENDGPGSRSFVLRSEESADVGWAVSYLSGGEDIADSILSADGFVTDVLASGAGQVVTVQITPSLLVPAETSKTCTLRAFLPGEEIVSQDAVQAVATVRGVTQADLLINMIGDSEDQFSVDGEYQQTPSGAQAKAQSVDRETASAFAVKIQNDGNTTRAFLLKALATTESGWQVLYRLGAMDVSEPIRLNGAFTPTLEPGGEATLLVEMVPGSSVKGLTGKTVEIELLYDQDAADVVDAVQARTTVNILSQPDLLIKKGTDPDSSYAIDGSVVSPSGYQPVPSGDQIETSVVNREESIVYQVKIENDGNIDRAYYLTATENDSPGWSVKYVVGGVDITDGIVKGAGYTTSTLAPASAEIITVQTIADSAAVGGSTKSCTIQSFLDKSVTAVRDVVKVMTTVNAITRADMLIRKQGEPDYAFSLNNVYEETPSVSQSRSLTVAPGTVGKFYAKIENDGNTKRNFVVRALESGDPGWATTYRWYPEDITGSITGANGWTTPVLLPGENAIIQIESFANRALSPGSTRSTIITVDGGGFDAAKVEARTSAVEQVDALIKKCEDPESLYHENDTYESSPTIIQEETQYVPSGTTACFDVRIENDGNTSRSYFARAEEDAGGGWTLRYLLDGIDVTDSIAHVGIVTANLSPSGYQSLRVEMTPAGNLSAGIRKSVVIKLSLSANILTVRDVVKATAFTGTGYPPLITSIDPRSGASGRVIEIADLHGAGFSKGALVKLVVLGQSDIYGQQVSIVSDQQIACRFDLRGGATAGEWDVVVRNLDGQTGYLQKAFTVRPAETIRDVALTQLTASPDTVRKGQRITFAYVVKNLGNIPETGLKFRLLQGENQIGNPKILATVEAGQQINGTLSFKVPRRTNPGEYFITGEVVPVTGETSVENNRQTIKVTVQ